MKKQLTYTKFLMETIILTGAVAIIAAAVYFFLVPSHTSVSSISGLGIVLSNFIPLPLSAITMILNVVLLIIGFITCGKEFGVKTVYTSIMLPLFLGLFEKIFPDFGSMTNSQELDVLCYILIVSVGLSILFNRNASSGGLDIVAKIMNKYLHMDLGKAMSLSGMCVALSAAFVYDKKTVVLSILGTYFNGIVLDHFIFDHNIKRRVCIITQKEEELRNFMIKYHRPINVGKSTLMNYLIGQKIAITSNKPQTTRNRIQTVLTTDEGQIVFVDTPGIHKAKNKLGEYMVNVAEKTLNEVDVVLWLVEPTTFIGAGEQHIAKQLQRVKTPVILVINKVDSVKREEILPAIAAYKDIYDFADIVPVSARSGDNTDELLRVIMKYLPYGPQFYDEDTVTDQPERQIWQN